jgi:hypothetical protein
MHGNPNVVISGHKRVYLVVGEIPPEIPPIPAITDICTTSLIYRSPFTTPTAMLKRDIPFRFTESKRYAEDLYLWQQIAFAGLQVMRIESPLAYAYKAPYGEGGLSAQLIKMEKGELTNLVDLYNAGCISKLLWLAASCFSILKYFKRLVVTWTKRIALNCATKVLLYGIYSIVFTKR